MATTRVETMLGDTAIAVHPNDERYKVCCRPGARAHIAAAAMAVPDTRVGSGGVDAGGCSTSTESLLCTRLWPASCRSSPTPWSTSTLAQVG